MATLIYLILAITGIILAAVAAYFLMKGYGIKDFIIYSLSCILIYLAGYGIIWAGSVLKDNIGIIASIISLTGYLIVYILTCLIIFGIVSVIPGMEFHKNIKSVNYYSLAGMTFIFIIILWCVVSYAGSHEGVNGEMERGLINRNFLPAPSEVISEGLDMLTKRNIERPEKDFYINLWTSIVRIMWGFGVAVALAVPLGILMGSFKQIEALFEPLFAFIRYMPPTAFIPLAIIWAPAIENIPSILIFTGVFFYLLVLIMDHVANVQKELLETSYTLGANKLEVLTMVIYPAIMPGVLDSAKAMIGAAWTYLIAAELVGAGKGIGYTISIAQRYSQTGRVFVSIIIIGIIGIITNSIFELLYRWLFPWKRTER